MAHSVSSKKRIRQNEKRRLANRAKDSRIKTEKRKFVAAIESKNVEAAAKQIPIVSKLLDKAAKTNLVHPNTASRTKSRYQTRLNALQAAVKAEPPSAPAE